MCLPAPLGLRTNLYIVLFQGSTIVNDLYGSVNRTGLILAGAALVGVSGQNRVKFQYTP